MDRVDALSIPEICGLVAALLTKEDLSSCARTSKRWHSYFVPFLWRHLRSHTNSYSVIAPFQGPIRAVSSSNATSARAISLTLSQTSLSGSSNNHSAAATRITHIATGGSMSSASPPSSASPLPVVPPFNSTLAKYGQHIFSLQIQARDLPLFVDHCPHIAQLTVTIFSDLGWENLLLFANAHPALSMLDLQLKNRPQRSGEGVADLLTNKLTQLRKLVLNTPLEIPSSTLLSILAAGKQLDSLTIGTSAFIQIGNTGFDSTDDEDEDDNDDEDDAAEEQEKYLDAWDSKDAVNANSQSKSPTPDKDPSSHPRSALRHLKVTGGIRCSSIVDILQCSPGLQVLQLGGNIPLHIPSLSRAIRHSCHRLESLGLGFFSALTDSSFAHLVRAFGPTSRLKTLSVPSTYTGDETIMALADQQCQTLEELDITGGMTKISSRAIQLLLMHCSRLRRLELGKGISQQKQTALQADDMTLGPWACGRLEYLSLPIVGCVVKYNKVPSTSDDHPHHLDTEESSGKERQGSSSIMTQSTTTSGASSSVVDYSEQVYKQLGKLRHLIVLDIGGTAQTRRGQIPPSSGEGATTTTGSSSGPLLSRSDGHLTWTLDSGLHYLERLSQLSTLRVPGKLDSIGVGEVEWMKRHWPRLTQVQCSGPMHPKTRDLLRKHLPRISNL
ncbi:hypothetical protein BGW42_003612 [Actinomortierella wolfii]|nr:hypothetical protein BGW42_003612 [Actinomortierella wolfii]